MSSIKQLNIKAGDGLSQAIDGELDRHFRCNVKLNKEQWQSIFNIITDNAQADQEGNQRQFSSNEKDITNKKNFLVYEGIYNLTMDTWNKIVDFTQKVLNPKQSSTASETTEEVVEEQSAQSTETGDVVAVKNEDGTSYQINTKKQTITLMDADNKIIQERDMTDEEKTLCTKDLINQLQTPSASAESNEAAVMRILTEANIDTTNIDMDLVNQKYEELLSVQPALDETIIAQRIKNFTILQRKESFEDAEKRFAEQLTNTKTSADQIANLEDESTKYVDAGITKAMESGDLEKYKAAILNFGKERLSEYDKNGNNTISRKEFRKIEQGSGDAKIKRKDLNTQFDFLDVNHDNKIDAKEMAAFFYAESRYYDGEDNTNNDITYAEWFAGQTVMSLYGNKDLDDEQKSAIKKFTDIRNDGYKNL